MLAVCAAEFYYYYIFFHPLDFWCNVKQTTFILHITLLLQAMFEVVFLFVSSGSVGPPQVESPPRPSYGHPRTVTTRQWRGDREGEARNKP